MDHRRRRRALPAGVIQLVKLPACVDAPTTQPGRAAAGDDGDRVDDAAASARAARRALGAHSPWRDPRYLAFTALSAVFGMQFGVAEVGVPLWIAHETAAPEVLVAVVLILNTVIVVLFQVPLSKGTHDLRRAGRVSAITAWLMAARASSTPGRRPARGLRHRRARRRRLAHAFAEVLSQAGGWGLSFELADPMRAGTYQGVFSMGYSVGAMVAPLVVNATAIALGFAGWAMLAVVFLASGLGTWAIARAADFGRTRATRDP